LLLLLLLLLLLPLLFASRPMLLVLGMLGLLKPELELGREKLLSSASACLRRLQPASLCLVQERDKQGNE